ncbi:MAG: exonuclease SbcCD subunit D [Treponemataceae bacterium]|nr:exonuclease SbcCD subunit D [Treponemataceae bacterium]
MKILQTGDLHLGKILHEYSLLDDQRDMLNQLLSELKKQYDALVITGDVYDRSVPPPEAVDMFDHFLTQARKTAPDTHIFIIPGNHDSARRLGFGAHLLETANIHIAQEKDLRDYLTGKVHQYPLMTELTDAEGCSVRFYSVPFVNEADTEKALTMITGELDGTPSFLISHCFAAGSDPSDSERIIIGTQGNISKTFFAPFTYAALGHIHKPQKVSANAWYSGSPLAYSFSEAGQEKHFLSITITTGTTTVSEIPVHPRRPLSSIRGSYESLLTSREFDAFTDHYLEVRCTDTFLSDNPMARLKERFPYVMLFRREDLQGTADTLSAGTKESLERRKSLFEGAEGKENMDHRAIASAFLEDLGYTVDGWQSELDLFEQFITDIRKGEHNEAC